MAAIVIASAPSAQFVGLPSRNHEVATPAAAGARESVNRLFAHRVDRGQATTRWPDGPSVRRACACSGRSSTCGTTFSKTSSSRSSTVAGWREASHCGDPSEAVKTLRWLVRKVHAPKLQARLAE